MNFDVSLGVGDLGSDRSAPCKFMTFELFKFLADLGDFGQFLLVDAIGRRQHELLLPHIAVCLTRYEGGRNLLKTDLG